jgi:hypothetical protein
LQERLLLCLNGIGTNTGLKRMAAGQDDVTYRDLLYVRRRFLTRESDVGRAVNPMIVHGQVHGGIVQRVGQALMEDVCYDRGTAQPIAGSFMDYAMPRADRVPHFDCELSEVPSPTHSLGIRPAGEGGTTPALAVVINAVVDALAEFGVRQVEVGAVPGSRELSGFTPPSVVTSGGRSSACLTPPSHQCAAAASASAPVRRRTAKSPNRRGFKPPSTVLGAPVHSDAAANSTSGVRSSSPRKINSLNVK